MPRELQESASWGHIVNDKPTFNQTTVTFLIKSKSGFLINNIYNKKFPQTKKEVSKLIINIRVNYKLNACKTIENTHIKNYKVSIENSLIF